MATLTLAQAGIVAPLNANILLCQPVGQITSFRLTVASNNPIVSFVIPAANLASCQSSINNCSVVTGCQAPSNILKYAATAMDYSCSVPGTDNYYACLWNPSSVVNVTTLTGSATIGGATGTFSNSTLAPIAIKQNTPALPFGAAGIAAPITPSTLICLPISETCQQVLGAPMSHFELISTSDQPIVAFLIPKANYANCSSSISKCTPVCSAPSNITADGAVAIDLGCVADPAVLYSACIWNPSNRVNVATLTGGVALNSLSTNFSRSSLAPINNTVAVVNTTTTSVAAVATSSSVVAVVTSSSVAVVATSSSSAAATATVKPSSTTGNTTYNDAVSTGASAGLFVMAFFLAL